MLTFSISLLHSRGLTLTKIFEKKEYACVSKSTQNDLKHIMQKKASKNVSAKRQARGGEATENASAKPEEARKMRAVSNRVAP